MMDFDYPCPLSGGLRGLLLKYKAELSQNPGPFDCNVPRAIQCMLKAMFIRDHKFEVHDKYLQMDR